jgi:hypothetical protein
MMGERRVMQEALFYGFSLERHVPDDHLLQKIDRFVDLSERSARAGETFSDVILRLTDSGPYAALGRSLLDLPPGGHGLARYSPCSGRGLFVARFSSALSCGGCQRPCASTLMSVDRALSKRDFMVRGLGRKKQA